MCTYNSAETLEYAIESVRNQMWQEWELIILDNGSQDATVKILKEYAKKDSRIICTYKNKNIGWCKGISNCLELAKGQYMMFLGADDYLANDYTLYEVKEEIMLHEPDIIWTACAFAVFENGVHRIKSQINPAYRVYTTENKLTQIFEIMQYVYYNSVMHYVKISFLRENEIDFYDPFYGDNGGMTEALCKAGTMVVMDKVEYVLTLNTSQTVQRTEFYHRIGLQWASIKKVLPDLKNCPKNTVAYIAERILINIAAMFENIVMGANLRDDLMNPIHKSLSERFLQAEKWLSSDSVGEMIYYAGKQKYEERLIGAVGVLYWTCKKYTNLMQEIQDKSMWLADFVERVLYKDKDGNIAWCSIIHKEESECLLKAVAHEANPHKIGCEILLREGIVFEESGVKEQMKQNLQEYLVEMTK